eukprot:403336314
MTMKVAYVLATLKFLNYCLYTLIVPFFPIILAQKGLSEKWIGYIFRYYYNSKNDHNIVHIPSAVLYLPHQQEGILQELDGKSLFQLVWMGCVLFLFVKYVDNKSLVIGISLMARVLQGVANALTQPTSQSILLIYYNGSITKPMSVMEASGAIGATFGPFIGSTLNYLFGYEGPFIVFSVLYIQIFSFLVTYVPSDVQIHDHRQQQDQKSQKQADTKEHKYINDKDKLKNFGQSQQIRLDFNLYSKQDLNLPLNQHQENKYYTDPEDENQDYRYEHNYGMKNEYQGLHPFFDDFPQIQKIKRQTEINNIYDINLGMLDNISTSYRQSSIKKGDQVQPTQMMILFKNLQVFGTIFTFFISTCLWVYIEPILSLYLVKQYQLQGYTTPLFFLVFSAGYLLATFSLIKYNRLKLVSSKTQSVAAFILAGVAQILVSPPYNSLNLVWLTSIGLFLFGFFTTFTLVPIYNDMLRSLDKHFELNKMSLSEVIDLCSSLTSLIEFLSVPKKCCLSNCTNFGNIFI